MKTLHISLLFLLSAQLALPADDLTAVLQQALFNEEADHDLAAAIKAYQFVVTGADAQRKLAATAVFRLGECYRKLGQTNEAIAQYRRIVDQFTDQTNLVTLSRQNLAGLGVRLGSPVGSTNAARREQKRLLEEEIRLVEKDLARAKALHAQNLISESDLAEKQRQLLGLQRQLAGLEEGLAETGAAQPGIASAPAATDEEEKEVRRIQALIKDSPDLINASGTDWTPLQQAAAKGQLLVARYLLENGANVDQMTSDHRGPALLLAAAQGHKSMVELLLAKGANPNVKDQTMTTALHEAAAKGFVTVIEVLLANKAELEGRNNFGETPLHRAVNAGQTAVVEMLLKHGADASARRDSGDTPLHLAAARGDVRTINVLLKNNANVNVKNRSGVPPVGEAIASGHVEAVQMLLENGATTDFVLSGGSPVHGAVGRNSTELVQLLLKHKEASDLPNVRGLTPLQSVVIDQRKPELIPLLVNAGANPNTPLPASAKMTIRDRTGSRDQFLPHYPILIAAILRLDLPQVEAILANGADVNAFVPDGGYQSTALMFAVYSDALEIVEAVLRYKPNLELRTKNESRTALHQAVARAERLRVDIVEVLIKAGANVDATDEKGWTPLHIAAWDGKAELISALLKAGANPNIHAHDGALPLSLARRTSGPAVLVEATRQEISKLLLQHGADESLLRRRTITVTRRGRNYENVVFTKGTNEFNRFSLYELIADFYSGIGGHQKLPFPDLRQLAIERFQAGTGTRQILVNLEGRANDTACTNDLWLEWGDLVEIRETEHPLGANWPGMDGRLATNIAACLGRTVEIVIKGRTNRVELRANPNVTGQTIGVGGVGFVNGFQVNHDSFRLVNVLQRSGLLLTSSDLARVRVRRRDPVTGQRQEWIIDETSRNAETDFWLRDRDVIEVPEKDPNAAPASTPAAMVAPNDSSFRPIPARNFVRPASEPK
jgi:ankyrin repeat protein